MLTDAYKNKKLAENYYFYEMGIDGMGWDEMAMRWDCMEFMPISWRRVVSRLPFFRKFRDEVKQEWS